MNTITAKPATHFEPECLFTKTPNPFLIRGTYVEGVSTVYSFVTRIFPQMSWSLHWFSLPVQFSIRRNTEWCFMYIVKQFWTLWSSLLFVSFTSSGNRDHGGCDRWNGDAYSSETLDPTFSTSRDPCFPHSLICIFIRTYEIYYCSLPFHSRTRVLVFNF
jgi:hypothetical protein